MNTSWQQAALFRPVSRRPLAPQIADQLRRHIVLGSLREHDKLPALRRLAAMFGVSLPTMREGVQTLAYLGVVKIEHGVGVFVAKGPESHRAIVAGLRRADQAEMVELRRILEVEAARRSAGAGESNALADLPLWQWERAAWGHTEPARFVRADLEFHRAILAASGSLFATSLHAQLCARLRPRLLADARRQAGNPTLDTLHASLVKAIDRHATELAAQLARQIARAEAPTG